MIPGNGIGAEGAKALAPTLGHLTQLKELNMYSEYCICIVSIVMCVVCECRGCERVCVHGLCWLLSVYEASLCV